MKRRVSAWICLSLALGVSVLSASDVGSLAKRELATMGAAISLPSAWVLIEEFEDGVVVLRNEGDSPAFSITMTPDIPARTGMKPSEYGAELLAFAAEEGAQISRVQDGSFQKFRVTYSFDTDGDKTCVTDMVVANNSTGTLYFIAWQVPELKARQYEPLRDAILASLQFDPKR
ncbi:MAG: hypothetical protein Fur0032_19450 [Terrimicrobiaceae bacterium]